MEEINACLTKFNHFKNAEIRSIQSYSDASIIVTLAVQDEDGEDTDRVEIELVDIKDKRLLGNAVLPFLDMMNGINIIHERDRYAFVIGPCDAMLHVLSAPLYIVSSDINVREVAV